jgi:hypothetical protein
MDKNITTKFSFSEIKASLRSASLLTSNPDRVWRLVLAFALASFLAAVTFGWFVYDWANSIEELTLPPKVEKSIISIEQMENVIEKYEKKSENFEALKNTPPEAPILEAGVGSSVSNATSTRVIIVPESPASGGATI